MTKIGSRRPLISLLLWNGRKYTWRIKEKKFPWLYFIEEPIAFSKLWNR